MLEVKIKFKEVKYPKVLGKTTGGMYTNAVLKIDENILRFEYKSLNVLKYLVNQLPIEFRRGVNEPNKFYLNKFGEHKLCYTTNFKNCEITFKIIESIPEELNYIIKSWEA